jgi:glycosyltransferase involved in cell wall biosynthesis
LHVLTVTDAWRPQVNGVVRTIEATNAELTRMGHCTSVISPLDFLTVPCPGYSEIRLSLLPGRRLAKRMSNLAPDIIHIATEGPLGNAARRHCLRHQLPFTTAYHTRFPQYLNALYGIPEAWVYRFLKHFHGKAHRLLTPTDHVETELRQWGIHNVARWTRGVDLETFHPGVAPSALVADLPRPIFLCVGRVSIEKNIDAFLRLDLPGSKVVAGIGPDLRSLQARYPDVHFLGVLSRPDLAALYTASDVFVFPSRTDTFGLVMLEALACGTPVAAYPVQGPLDVVGGSEVAVLGDDLRQAALDAITIEAASCRQHAERHSWAEATRQFLAGQQVVSRG